MNAIICALTTKRAMLWPINRFGFCLYSLLTYRCPLTATAKRPMDRLEWSPAGALDSEREQQLISFLAGRGAIGMGASRDPQRGW